MIRKDVTNELRELDYWLDFPGRTWEKSFLLALAHCNLGKSVEMH